MFMHSTRTAFLTALGIAASATMLAVPASAQAEPGSKAVKYGDLDLATPAGVDSLNRRVRYAVRSVCGVDQAKTLREQASANDCAQVAQAEVAPRVELAVAQARSNRDYAANDIAVRAAR